MHFLEMSTKIDYGVEYFIAAEEHCYLFVLTP